VCHYAIYSLLAAFGWSVGAATWASCTSRGQSLGLVCCLPVDSSVVSQQSKTHSLLSMLQDTNKKDISIGLDLQKLSCRFTLVQYVLSLEDLTCIGAQCLETYFAHLRKSLALE
jgi:hypothetical protein